MAKPCKERGVITIVLCTAGIVFLYLIMYLECNEYGEYVSEWNESFVKDEYPSNPSQSHDCH